MQRERMLQMSLLLRRVGQYAGVPPTGTQARWLMAQLIT
jgi:hypothetical protein